MRDIPQFFEAEIVTRFAGAVPQKKELNPLVFNMERGICLAENSRFSPGMPALRPYDLILANELDSGCAGRASGILPPRGSPWRWECSSVFGLGVCRG